MTFVKKAVRSSVYLGMFGLALVVHAQTASSTSGTTFASFVNSIVAFVNAYVIPLLYVIAFLVMLFGLFRYFFTGGEENRTKGKAQLIWGIVGLVLIFSLWGVVNLLLSIIPT